MQPLSWNLGPSQASPLGEAASGPSCLAHRLHSLLLLQDLRRKAARLVAAKCTLAARVDSFHESSEGKVSVWEHL